MPIFLLLLIGGGAGVGGLFYGRDQHKKRVAEHTAFRQRTAEFEKVVKAKDDRIRKQDEQVRALAAELQKAKRKKGRAA